MILLVNQFLISQTIGPDKFSELNLINEDFSDHSAVLSGDWELYWNEFLPPGSDFSKIDAESIRVPDPWNKDKNHPANGFGTYRTRVKLPEGSRDMGITMDYTLNHYRLYINDKLIHQNGEPNTGWKRNTTIQRPVVLPLPDENELEIILHISNFDDLYGGLLEPPVIASLEQLNLKMDKNQMMDSFLFGLFLVIGILYILFYTSEGKATQSSLFFGLFTLTMALRTLLYNQHMLLLLLPGLPVEVETTLGHLTFYLAIPFFLRFICLEFPSKYNRLIEFPTYSISTIFCLLAIVTRHHFYIRFLGIYQILSLIVAITVFVLLIKRSYEKNSIARILLLGFIMLLGTSVNDILYAQKIIDTFHMAPLGLGLYIQGQAILLSWKIGKSFKASKDLAHVLEFTNTSFRRFVPVEFLKYLNKNSITDVELGDHVQMEMTIFFLDIRDFTSLSEKMSPRENFLFLNSYYERVCPVIRKHQGFIDKYMGDGIMALFAGPDSAENAALAAIEMKRILGLYNFHRSKADYDPVRVGIGIHTGSLMMGTIGENKRMDGTVISDAVNLCSRIESLTKEYGIDVAMSEETYGKLKNKIEKQVRFIGRIKVKGKETPVCIYELFNGDPKDLTELKLKTKEEFEKAVRLRDDNHFEEALQVFENVHTAFPQDRTTQIYLSRFRKSDS
jgi:class 3 adenylate cyclase